MTAYPQTLTQFRQKSPSLNIYLTYDENTHEYLFCEKNDEGLLVSRELPLNIKRTECSSEIHRRLWLVRSFQSEIEILAEQNDSSLRQTSIRYGELSYLYHVNETYEYNDQFGLVEV